jgi:N,N'-diacetyllegionaminate synthase
MKFIAEIGLNHNGNFGLLYELIKQAAYAGADIAKFQLGWRAGDGEMNALREADIEHIIKCSEHFSIEPMFSIFTPEAYELASQYDFSSYKIASRTIKENLSLCQKICDSEKEVYISLGMWDEDEFPIHRKNIKYLWCKSKYPSYPWDITDFPKDFKACGYAGYSDHTIGVDVPILAIARGAEVIEKHFTLDKSDTTIRDHALSATPDEFATLVKIGTEIHRNIITGI